MPGSGLTAPWSNIHPIAEETAQGPWIHPFSPAFPCFLFTEMFHAQIKITGLDLVEQQQWPRVTVAKLEDCHTRGSANTM